MISAIAHQLPAQFPLTQPQTVKVIAVAIATLLCFGATWALFSAGLTFLCEAMLHNGSQQNWFSTHSFSVKTLFLDMCDIFKGRGVILVAWVALTLLGLVAALPAIPQTKLAEMALVEPVRFLFKCIVVAPICEEILFRGFVQERFEDAAQLLNRHIYPLSRRAQEKMANVAQAILFGIVHILGGQVAPAGKWVVALASGWCGYVLGRRKTESTSLTAAMAEHSMNNTLASAALLYKQFA